MSMDMNSERVCYVQCNFCNTILAVNVPCSSMFTIVTVRCGHCANLLSVNVGALLQSVHLQDFQQLQKHHQQLSSSSTTISNINYEGAAGSAAIKDIISGSSSSSRCNMVRYTTTNTPFQVEHEQPKMPPIRPPEKRQRVPSAYNRFIKEEIQRIKTRNPEISHREAFSTAAKNWAHFPHIHFGLNVESNKQAKLDHPVTAGAEGTTTTMTQKSLGFY